MNGEFSSTRGRPAAVSAPAELDETGQAILAQLKEDACRSYASIASRIDLPEVMVRNRVHKMLDQGFLRIAAVTNLQLAKATHRVMIGIQCSERLPQVVTQLAMIPEIHHVAATTGSFDLLAEASYVDDGHLLHLLNQRIRTIAGVSSTETFIYLHSG